MASCAAAAFTDDSDGVGVVHEEPGTVLVADLDDAGQVRDITAHAEHAVNDDEAGLILAYPPEDRIEMPRAVVIEAHHLTLCQSAAVVNAGVIRFIDDSDRAAADERRDRA